jgi:hypothetical protein
VSAAACEAWFIADEFPPRGIRRLRDTAVLPPYCAAEPAVKHQPFDHAQMSAMRSAIDHLVEEKCAGADERRVEIATLVFRLGAETGVFEASALIEMARQLMVCRQLVTGP